MGKVNRYELFMEGAWETMQVPPFFSRPSSGPAIKTDPNSDLSANTDPSSLTEWEATTQEKSVLRKTGRGRERGKVSMTVPGKQSTQDTGTPLRGKREQRGERRGSTVVLGQLLFVQGTKSSLPQRALNFANPNKKNEIVLGF